MVRPPRGPRRSPRCESSSSPIGVSSEIGSCATLTISRTFSGVIPISSPISSSLGSRPSSWSRRRDTRTSLLIISIMCTGMRIVRALVGEGTGDGLPDPPRGVGRELVALVMVELLDPADQAHVAFLDEVEEGHAAPDVFLGDGHHESQVGFGEPPLGLVCALVALGQSAVSDPIDLQRLRSNSRRRGSVGPAPTLGCGGVEQARQPGEVVEAQQLLRDVRLLALALHGRQPLDHLWQHLVDGALAAVRLLDHVQRLERVVQGLGLDRLGELDLVVGGEQADAPDLLEVHAHRVVERDRVHHLDVEQHLVVDLLDLFEVLLAVGDLDPDLLEGGEDAEDLVGLRVDLGEALEDVVGREVALLLALDDQLLGNGDQLVFELGLRSLRSLGGAPRPGLDRGLYYVRPCRLLVSMSLIARASSLASAAAVHPVRRRTSSLLLSATFELSRVLGIGRVGVSGRRQRSPAPGPSGTRSCAARRPQPLGVSGAVWTAKPALE